MPGNQGIQRAGVLVGIGCDSDPDKIERSISLSGVECKVYRDPVKMSEDLISGKIDAAVRGDMSSSILLPILREKLGLERLERSVLMRPVGGRLFFMAPVGIDEGWTVEEKYELAVKTVKLMRDMRMGTRIAVLSGGRIDDDGRHEHVDASLEEAKILTEKLVSEGYDAYDAEILIENAAKEANLLIIPNGILGNMVFRTLHFLGGAAAVGAPLVNADKIFVDTSRVKVDYSDSIKLAARLAEGKK